MGLGIFFFFFAFFGIENLMFGVRGGFWLTL